MGSVLTLNGAIKDGMDGDIVTNVQKNMNGWVESGSGTVTLTYADGVNSFEFENGGGGSYTPPSTLQEVKDWYASYGYTNIDSICQNMYLYNCQNKVYAIYEDNNSSKCLIFAFQAFTGGVLTPSISGSNTFISQFVNGNSQSFAANWRVIDYNKSTHTYSEISNAQTSAGFIVADGIQLSPSTSTLYRSDIDHPVVTISKKYDLTLATEANKKYILTLGAKTSTGFTTGTDAIKITNGATTGTISLYGTSSNDFTEYKILFTAETTSVTIELDLSAIQSSSDIELDIKNVSFYEIGVAGGGGGGSDYEVVTEDFSFQCTSAYPETHEGATASRVVSVDNSNGYTYLQFTWSNNGAATGYGWVQGQYTFNGVTTQLYFQQNSISEIGDTVKLGIVGMGTTFDITFIVNATTNYQYSSSTAVLNITDVILTNE